MLVYDVTYTGEHESLSFLIEVVDDDNDVYHIKNVLINAINTRITQVKEDYDNAGYGNYSAHLYYTSIINGYTRLLSALEYTYSVHDLKDIPYINVRTRDVYRHN